MNEGALCKEDSFFVGGGREELAMVDAKLDWEIKLLAVGMDQLDNDKQSFRPKNHGHNKFTGIIYMLICKNQMIMIMLNVLSPHTKGSVCLERGDRFLFHLMFASCVTQIIGHNNFKYQFSHAIFTLKSICMRQNQVIYLAFWNNVVFFKFIVED